MNVRNTVCIVQARMGSSRLPGKVLAELAGRPMLEQILNRLRRARTLDRIVVATSNLPQDQPIVDHCAAIGQECFAGSHDDVLDRFARAAEAFAADTIVRVTADCPLIDPQVVDKVVGMLHENIEIDCACNFFPRRTFPRGLDVEAVTRATLDQLATTLIEPRFREHVTLGIYEKPERYRIGSLFSDQDWSGLRWTVDEPADLNLVRAIYASFGGRFFSWRQCLVAYRHHPQWREFNSHVAQKAA